VRFFACRRLVLLTAALMAFSFLDLGTAEGQIVPRPPRKGTRYRVTIDSSPQQAAIYLDEKTYGIVGYTPYRGTLVKGQYRLIVELPGHEPVDRPISIAAGKNDYFFPLSKKEMPGTIEIQASADPNLNGAQVFINGQAKGTVPQTIEVPKGRHLLELKKDKFNDFAQWVEVQDGQRVTVAPTLKTTAKGSLLIDSDVRGASITVNGRRLDETAPAIVDDLDEGTYVIEVSRPPAAPWKQTVLVKTGQRTKVTAELAAAVQAAEGGNLRVIVNIPDAEVWVDGENKGKQPVDVKGLSAGMHIVEARAEGYDPKEERVTINAGAASIVKLDLERSTGVQGPAGWLQVMSPVPNARVYVDGAVVGMTPWEGQVAAGERVVAVESSGYARYEEKVRIEAKQRFTVTAELRGVGSVQFVTDPPGAEVFLDGKRVGRTPHTEENIAVGDHVVAFRRDGYREVQQPINVAGGRQSVVNVPLRANDALTAAEVEELRRGLSSYGAMTVPPGRFTVDASVGYPYWVEARATIGIPGLAPLGADVAIGFRTLLTTWEFLATGKVRFVESRPFALAGFATVGGGGGADGRNQFTFQGGVVGSITFNNLVTVSARSFVDLWSDRLCKEAEAGRPNPTSGPDVCTGEATLADIEAARKLHGESDLTTRDAGARVYLSAIVEAGIAQNFNVFGIFEGAAFQSGRAAHSSLFNGSLLQKEDPIYNFRAGITFKF
jgi:hypothetical protein